MAAATAMESIILDFIWHLLVHIVHMAVSDIARGTGKRFACSLVCRHPAMTITSSMSHRGHNGFSVTRHCFYDWSDRA